MIQADDSLLLGCFQYFYHNDCANAAIHCADVRFSPITFKLAEALKDNDYGNLTGVLHVLGHRGHYELDHGR